MSFIALHVLNREGTQCWIHPHPPIHPPRILRFPDLHVLGACRSLPQAEGPIWQPPHTLWGDGRTSMATTRWGDGRRYDNSVVGASAAFVRRSLGALLKAGDVHQAGFILPCLLQTLGSLEEAALLSFPPGLRP